MQKIVIIGGGLAGLISSILLVRKGYEVILFEEKEYPFHRVCGEYISKEVIPFLKQNELYPSELEPADISQFHLTSPKGVSINQPLGLGGFGLSRCALDEWLFKIAVAEGVQFHFDRVVNCNYGENEFSIEARSGVTLSADLVIGAFGKRSNMDKKLDRSFAHKKHPYVGVKYHLKTDEVDDSTVALHNFKNGYCGISKVENEKFNVCYLTHRKNLKKYPSIKEMEQEVLYRNPFLKRIFTNADFLFDKPKVISEISFSSKEPVFDHILMIGDSAGTIAPLCGNGMAMAIHTAKLLSQVIIHNIDGGFDREALEKDYTKVWCEVFQKRIWIGRNIQHFFGASSLTELAIHINKKIPVITRSLMKRTHGAEF